MKIVKNLQNFLKDQEYYIDIFNDYIHIYYYNSLINLSNTLIELNLNKFNLIIEGKNLIINKMDNHEILIKGEISNLRFIR